MFGPNKVEKVERARAKAEELAVLRSQLKPKRRPKKDPIEAQKDYLAGVASNTYKDFAPQPYGPKTWWVMHFDKDGEDKYDGAYYSVNEADGKLAIYHTLGLEGEWFELRNIDNKSKAKEAIKDILKRRQEEEQALMQERITNQPGRRY